jgi:phosphatidate cytidylyltransferase
MYYQSFIAVYKASPGALLETAITGLTPEEQVELVKLLARHLVNQGQLATPALEYLGNQFNALKR